MLAPIFFASAVITLSASPRIISATTSTEFGYTNTCTITASGGTGSYTYLWELESGSGDIFITSPTSNTTNFYYTNLGSVGDLVSDSVRCTVTDSVGNQASIFLNVSAWRIS